MFYVQSLQPWCKLAATSNHLRQPALLVATGCTRGPTSACSSGGRLTAPGSWAGAAGPKAPLAAAQHAAQLLVALGLDDLQVVRLH